MTDRALTSGMATEVQAPVIRPCILYEGQFEGGTLRLWTGIGNLSWNGQTWTGGGNLLGISPLGESTQVEAEGFTVSLSGMPPATVALALASVRQGKPGKLWLALLDSTGAVIADPFLAQEGKFDIAVIDDDGEHCTIAANYESRLIELLKPRDRRYTPQDQKRDYAGDLGFDQVGALQDIVLIWGGPGAAASPIATPDSGGGGGRENSGGGDDGGGGDL